MNMKKGSPHSFTGCGALPTRKGSVSPVQERREAQRSTKWGARRAFHGAISSSEALKYYWYEIAMEEYYANKY